MGTTKFFKWPGVLALTLTFALAIPLFTEAEDGKSAAEAPAATNTEANAAAQPASIEMGDPETVILQLTDSPKLNFPKETLYDFRMGKTTTRVIVNLRDPELAPTRTVRPNFNDLLVREKAIQQVEAAQNLVIDVMDPNKVRITNRFTYIFGFSAEVSVEGLVSLVNHPDVISINKDGINHPHLAQGISLMNATTARSSYNGTGMAIAICDTGIDYGHTRLGNGGFPNSKVIGGYDTGENDTNPMDEHGHGTSCAGIAAGDLATVGDYIGGIAYNAKLYALKMSRADIGHSAYDSDMIEAWEWCITHRNDDPSNPIMIISTSFGGGHYTSESSCDAYQPAMATAAANAKAAGMTLFVSTGNDGFCNGTGWPGCLSDVIGVGAVYDADIGQYPDPGYVGCISPLSCTGYITGCPCSTGKCYVDYTTAADQVTTYSNSASFIELFAPSNYACTTALGGGYRTDFGGTSAACPYTAGAGAALQSAAMAKTGAYLTPDQVQSILLDNGDLVTDSKVSITKPRVNLGNAVAAIATDNLIFKETFDTFPPTGWNVINNGGDCGWVSNATAARVNYTGGSGDCADADSDSCGPSTTMDTELRTPLIDLSGVPNAVLEFKTDYNAFGFSDFAYVDISTDGGSTWTNLLTWNEGHRGPLTVQLNLTPHMGFANVVIRWRYVASGWDWWWEIDDVTISGTCYGDELAADFGTNGLWHYDGASWSKLTTWNPDDDLTGWSGGLAVDFGGDGLWNHDGTSWSQKTSWNLGSGGLAGWSGGLAADFDADGLWVFDGTFWSKKTSWNPDNLAGWSGGLAVDFGTDGLWSYDGSSWSKLTTWNPTGMSGWNGGLAVGFSTTNDGLWSYDGSSWHKLTSWNPDNLAGWSGGLAVDFGTDGLWSYDGSSWSRLTTWNPTGMSGWGGGLAVDFGADGLWNYDGTTWSKKTSWQCENMADVDLN